MSYFKHSDVGDTVDRMLGIVAEEPDIERKSALVVTLMDSISSELTRIIGGICYDSYLRGTASDITAVRLGISQRSVKRFIRSEAVKRGERNPLRTRQVDEFIDIRDRLE